MLVLIAGYSAGIVTLLGYFFYAYSIIRGRTRPSRTSWLIWSILTLLITTSYIGTGATNTLWAAVGDSLGTFFIFLLSIKYGLGGWDPLDRYVLIGTVFGIILWYVSGSAVLAVLAFLFADFMGAIPTAVKTYKAPWEEEWFPWAVTVFANVLTIVALDLTAVAQWEFGIAVYPFYFTLTNGAILLFILRPKLFPKSAPTQDHH